MLKRQILAVVACFTMLYAQACSFKSALAQLENWAPVVLNGFAGVVSIVNPPAGSALAIAAGLVPKLWGDATSAMNTYASNASTSNLGNLIAALNAVNSQWNQVMTDLGQTGNTQDIQTAKAAMTVLIVTLDSIEAKLQPATVSPTAAAVRVPVYTHATLEQQPTVNGVSVQVVPATSASSLKSQLNHIFTAGGHPEAKLS